MNKAELLEALEDVHNELIEMLEGEDDEVMLEKGVAGDWSIKDILAHLTQWEGQIVTLLFQARQGVEKPTTIQFGNESVDKVNERWHQQSQDRPLGIIWTDFQGVRKQTIRRVSEMSDADLTNPNRYPWMKGVALMELIISDTIEHEQEHGDQIREWLDQRDAKSNGSGKH